jgi:hypothetical protein
MSRTFIKSILIAAVTVTGITVATTGTAKAGNDDIAKILFGATALFIIGKAITDSDAQAAPIAKPRPPVVVKPKPRPRYSKALPAKCLRRHHTWDGRVRMMSGQCLRRNYEYAHRLPQSCRTRVYTDDGVRRGYQMRCLRDRGYYLASR